MPFLQPNMRFEVQLVVSKWTGQGLSETTPDLAADSTPHIVSLREPDDLESFFADIKKRCHKKGEVKAACMHYRPFTALSDSKWVEADNLPYVTGLLGSAARNNLLSTVVLEVFLEGAKCGTRQKAERGLSVRGRPRCAMSIGERRTFSGDDWRLSRAQERCGSAQASGESSCGDESRTEEGCSCESEAEEARGVVVGNSKVEVSRLVVLGLEREW